MAGPWEKYARPVQNAPAAEGPWTKYAAPSAPEPSLPPADSGGPRTRRPAHHRAREGTPEPSLFRMDSDFAERGKLIPGHMLIAGAKDMFGSRQGSAEYLARQTRGKVVQDADGEPLVELPDGKRYRLNDPGLDNADVGNVAGNIAALFTPATAINNFNKVRNFGRGKSMVTQALGMGGADAALQVGFDEGRIDPVRTGITAAGGAAGELIGPLVTKGAEIIRKLMGSGAPREVAAAELARTLGLKSPTSEQIGRLSTAVDEIAAGTDPRAVLGREEFGFIYTQGQRTLDPAARRTALTVEEGLRQTKQGGEVFAGVEARNQDALTTALDGIRTKWGSGTTPAALAEDAAARVGRQAEDLKGRVDNAYGKVAEINGAAIGADAVRSLPARLAQAVREIDIHPGTTPAAARALEQVREATAKILASGEGASVRGVTLRALETQRRMLGYGIDAGKNPTDRMAMTALKREFDGWLGEAVEDALVSGDQEALAVIREARGLRAEFGRRFEGGHEADKFIAGMLDGSRTPEELVNIALGAASVSKAGGARFIHRLAEAAGGDPQVISNLRAAHFLRLTQDVTGKPLDMGRIVRNIAASEYSNASIVKALYSPKEWAEVQRLAMALQPMLVKGDLARTSGSGERIMRQLLNRVGGRLPLIGDSIRGIAETIDGVQAARAVNAPLRQNMLAPPYAPATAAVASDEATR